MRFGQIEPVRERDVVQGHATSQGLRWTGIPHRKYRLEAATNETNFA